MYRLLLLMPLSHFWPFNIDLCYFQRWSLQWLTFAGQCVWHPVHCEPRKQTWQFACWPIPTWIVCVYSARLKYDLQNLYLALAMYDKNIFFESVPKQDMSEMLIMNHDWAKQVCQQCRTQEWRVWKLHTKFEFVMNAIFDFYQAALTLLGQWYVPSRV